MIDKFLFWIFLKFCLLAKKEYDADQKLLSIAHGLNLKSLLHFKRSVPHKLVRHSGRNLAT